MSFKPEDVIGVVTNLDGRTCTVVLQDGSRHQVDRREGEAAARVLQRLDPPGPPSPFRTATLYSPANCTTCGTTLVQEQRYPVKPNPGNTAWLNIYCSTECAGK